MSSYSRRQATGFALSFGLVASGLVVSFWAIRAVQLTSLNVIATFALAYGLVDAMGVRLARGDTVFVDAAVSLSAVVALNPWAAVVACLVGTVLGTVFNPKLQRASLVQLGEILRRPVLVAILGFTANGVLDRAALSQGSLSALLICAALGIAYSLADFTLLAAAAAIDTSVSMYRAANGLARSLSALYAVHISLGVATTLLLSRVGTWGLWAMVALVLLSQYSFNLLLRTRRAYSETIQALMRASELCLDESVRGHSQRVADIAVNAGRVLGLPSAALEQLNYAALLHEIGRIGIGNDSNLNAMAEEYAQRGAAIVGEIPFLQATKKMISAQRDSEQFAGEIGTEALCAGIIGACCDLDRAAVQRPGRWKRATDVQSLESCLPDHVTGDLRSAVLLAASRLMSSQ